ncbi:MAG: hypothetical protein R3C12_13530 [Planctomycetaceae bacterium]
MNFLLMNVLTLAQQAPAASVSLDWRRLLEAGGYVGYVIIGLSVIMVRW